MTQFGLTRGSAMGWLRRDLHPRVRVRRSTTVLIVLFAGSLVLTSAFQPYPKTPSQTQFLGPVTTTTRPAAPTTAPSRSTTTTTTTPATAPPTAAPGATSTSPSSTATTATAPSTPTTAPGTTTTTTTPASTPVSTTTTLAGP